jgi:hypothetical protein
MPSLIIKSPVSDGSRATFEELHSLWQVFGQEQGFNEYQSIVPHPDLPVDGHNAVLSTVSITPEVTGREGGVNIIENIGAITEDDDKKEAESNSSDSMITEVKEDYKDPPETEGGSIKEAVESLATPASTSASGAVGRSKSSSSSSTSSSSTGGSSKSDISSSDSSDSSRSLYSSDSDSDSDTSAANKNKKYKYNKMPSSSILKVSCL